jgi:hypothetical protein
VGLGVAGDRADRCRGRRHRSGRGDPCLGIAYPDPRGLCFAATGGVVRTVPGRVRGTPGRGGQQAP